MHIWPRALLSSCLLLAPLKLGCYSLAAQVLSGTTTTVGPSGPRLGRAVGAMAAATTGGSRWHEPDVVPGASFLRSHPADPVTGRPCAACREWRIF